MTNPPVSAGVGVIKGQVRGMQTRSEQRADPGALIVHMEVPGFEAMPEEL